MNNKGFTLIELLVSVAVVALLAATAVSEFTIYKQRTYDTLAKFQLLNIIKAIEASESAFLDLNDRTTGVCRITFSPDGSFTGGNNCSSASPSILPGFTHQKDVFIRIISFASSSARSFQINAAHCKGTPGTSSGHRISMEYYNEYSANSVEFRTRSITVNGCT